MIANFIIPGLSEKFNLNKNLIFLKKQHPDWFYENINFYSTYGSFQHNIWDGGRTFYNYHQNSIEDVINILNFYNDEKIVCRLVCTNPIINQKDLSNHFMNLVLELLEKNSGEIVINSLLLENYIIKKYPNIKLISSTTKRLNNFSELNKELEKEQYSMVCLDYDLNKNFLELQNIKKEYRKKCEFLVNAICPPNCPNRKEHYRLNGISQLNYGKDYTIDCNIKYGTLHPKNWEYKNNISPIEIFEKYIPTGFQNFKLEGRTFQDSTLIGNYVRYFLKPEYQLIGFETLIQSINNI